MRWLSLSDCFSLTALFPQCYDFIIRDVRLSRDVSNPSSGFIAAFAKVHPRSIRLDGPGPSHPGGAVDCVVKVIECSNTAFESLTSLDLGNQFQPMSLLLTLVFYASRFPQLRFLEIRPIQDAIASHVLTPLPLQPFPVIETARVHLCMDVFQDYRAFRVLLHALRLTHSLFLSQRFCMEQLDSKHFRFKDSDWCFTNLQTLEIPAWTKLIHVVTNGRLQRPSRFPELRNVSLQLCDQWTGVAALDKLSFLLPGVKMHLTGFGQTPVDIVNTNFFGEVLFMGCQSAIWWPNLVLDTVSSLEVAFCPENFNDNNGYEGRISPVLCKILRERSGKLDSICVSTLLRDGKPELFAEYEMFFSKLQRTSAAHLLPLLTCGGDRLKKLTLPTEVWLASGMQGHLENMFSSAQGRFVSVKLLSLLRFSSVNSRAVSFPAELQYRYSRADHYSKGLENLCGLFPNLEVLTLHTEPSFSLSALEPVSKLCPRLRKLHVFHLALAGSYLAEPLRRLLLIFPLLEILALHVTSLWEDDFAKLTTSFFSGSLQYVLLYALEGDPLSWDELQNLAQGLPNLRWLVIFVESQETCFTIQAGIDSVRQDKPMITKTYCRSFPQIFTLLPQLYHVLWAEELRGRCRHPYWLPESVEESSFEGRVCNLNTIFPI